jgi:putative ABC transport system ATP-binding protein
VSSETPVAERRSTAVVVSADDITKRYGSGDIAVDALRGVTVDFPRGQFAAVMGPSGSGKSTLMHICAGLDQPSSGRVVIDDVDITRLKERELTLLRRDRIGFIFQSFNLLPMLTVDENVVLPMRIAGRRIGEDELVALLEAVGLADRRTHRPAELSGGQQQRVDSRTSAEILELLRRSADEYGQTLVMVTHDAHAATIADRIIFLQDGRIVQDRPKMESSEIFDVVASLE